MFYSTKSEQNVNVFSVNKARKMGRVNNGQRKILIKSL